MKKSKITPLGASGNDKILIDAEQYSGSERLELICNDCHQNLVKLSDRQGTNEEWFCRNCSIVYPDPKEIRQKHRLSVPHETEPAVSIVNIDYTKDVEIRHEPTLKGGAAELAKRGTIRFTHYEDSSQR